jgi:hypothetical protein
VRCGSDDQNALCDVENLPTLSVYELSYVWDRITCHSDG